MRIGLIRHGETDWNAQQRLQGAMDIPLNDRGLEQAEDAARLLRGHEWARVHASTLGRARRTAEIIAEHLELPAPVLEPELVERSFGELEGMRVYDDEGNRVDLEHPSVETRESVVERSLAALRGIAERARGAGAADTLVVAHGTVIRFVLTELLGWPAPHISNLAMSVIEVDDDAPGGFRVVTANGYPIADAARVR
ncbi:MAG: histidine phosphatase family protein [Microbacteriaceae bacterium]|nr:histidine phosphatase family protein [Microbacteriaceae bacterium]